MENNNNNIPKTIHYVWMGRAEKSRLIKRCIRSWHKHLPEYEIIEWNEDNFDISMHPYVEEAYKQKKWAFVSDYVRMWVLYTYGGIYLDTDNVVLDSLDSLLKNKAFIGFERPDMPFTACFGSIKGHPFISHVLDYYENQSFEVDENNLISFNNTLSVSAILDNYYSVKRDNTFQILDDDIALYPDDVLCNPSSKSKVIHVFTGTWLKDKSKLSQFVTTLKSFLNKPWKAGLYQRIFMRKKV
jgi:hypothetical protein